MAKVFYTEDFMKDNTYPTPKRLNFKDITGNEYGKVKVISWAGNKIYGDWKYKRNVWWAKCGCGSTEYFLVDRKSLEKGLTTSCGCKYKNNGGTKSEDKDFLKSKIDPRYEVLHYEGMNHLCTVECGVCGDVVSNNTGYAVRQRKLVCSCQETLLESNAKQYGYSLSLNYEENKKVTHLKCDSCGVAIPKKILKDKCPCHYNSSLEDISKASAVYLLSDTNNSKYFKIGKSNDPYERINSIQNSCVREGYTHEFNVEGIKWFSSEKVAYYVESLYHQEFKDKTVYGFKGEGNNVFDGSSEVFKLDRQDFVNFNTKYKSHIDFLQVEDVKFVINRPFLENVNKLKTHKGVGVYIPHKSKFLEDNNMCILKNCRKATIAFNNISEVGDILDTLKKMYFSIGKNNYRTLSSLLKSLSNVPLENRTLFEKIVREVRHFKDENALYSTFEKVLIDREVENRENLKTYIMDESGCKISLNSFIAKEGLALTINDIKTLLREGKSYREIVSVGGYYKVCPLVFDRPSNKLISINAFISKYAWRVSSSYMYIKISGLLNNHKFRNYSEQEFKGLSEKFLTDYGE